MAVIPMREIYYSSLVPESPQPSSTLQSHTPKPTQSLSSASPFKDDPFRVKDLKQLQRESRLAATLINPKPQINKQAFPVWSKTNNKNEKKNIKNGITDSSGNMENSGHGRGFYRILRKSIEGLWRGSLSMGLGNLCLLIDAYRNQAPTLLQRLGDRGTVSFDDYISKWQLF